MDIKEPKISIIIPAYNEINTLSEILNRVKSIPLNKEIIIIDDGSTDGTKELLRGIKEDGLKIIFNDKNRGKGFSIRRGFDCVSADIVIIQDADLEYYPDEYPALIQKIIDGKADVVYGTRFLGARRVFKFYHYLGNGALNLIANFLYDTNLSDLMTGYKVFKADVLRKLKLRANGFGIEAEITAQIFKRRLRVYEVPISYDGRDYDEGKKVSWRDFFISLYWLIRCRLESYDVAEDTLFRMKLMENNNKWIFAQIRPYIGSSILEVGSGIGSISKLLIAPNRNIVLTEVNKDCLEYLRRRFTGNPWVKVLLHDIAGGIPAYIGPLKFDTAICINVLEHIENDEAALENIYKILEEGGRLLLVVPALKVLYGSLDKQLGHFRRYEKDELVKKLKARNFTIEKIYYHNFISSIGWFVNGRILKRRIISSLHAILLDKFIPFLSRIEKVVKIPFGLSTIVICRKESRLRQGQ